VEVRRYVRDKVKAPVIYDDVKHYVTGQRSRFAVTAVWRQAVSRPRSFYALVKRQTGLSARLAYTIYDCVEMVALKRLIQKRFMFFIYGYSCSSTYPVLFQNH